MALLAVRPLSEAHLTRFARFEVQHRMVNPVFPGYSHAELEPFAIQRRGRHGVYDAYHGATARLPYRIAFPHAQPKLDINGQRVPSVLTAIIVLLAHMRAIAGRVRFVYI